MKTMYQSDFKELKLVKRGKVRDVYDLGSSLLFVATDRISAFDVVMNEPIPGKGETLATISAFWFEKTKEIIDNHFITNEVEKYPVETKKYKADLEKRSMLVKKLKPLPIECIARGYLAGSAWKEYKKSGTVTGIPLPKGLKEYQKLPEPIYTPSTKAEEGHDENIDFAKSAEIVGEEIAQKVKELTIKLYKFGEKYLNEVGLILADTKFEFGTDENGKLYLIDEALTPDSSRFWDKNSYELGKKPEQFDKQILRDYLLSLEWDKTPPPPKLPPEIIEETAKKYKEVTRMIVK